MTRTLNGTSLILGLAAALFVGCDHAPPASDADQTAPPGDETHAYDAADPPSGLETIELTIAGETFHLELALDQQTRYRGLADRPYIPRDGGMLFAFPQPARLTFVMRDCLVPIDLIFLDAQGRIINMHEMPVEPRGRPEFMLTRYHAAAPAQFAIELRAGSIERLSLQPGQTIELPTQQLAQAAR